MCDVVCGDEVKFLMPISGTPVLEGKLMEVLGLVGLPALMAISSGRRQVVVGLIDGPVFLGHQNLATASIREIPRMSGGCTRTSSLACRHGTFVAGIFAATRRSSAPAICPDCSLLVRPIFSESVVEREQLPSATPQQLAQALCDCVRAGAWIVNLSSSMAAPSASAQHQLCEALDFAAGKGVLVVAAAGNQGSLGSSAITRHPWVIPVVGYGTDGRLMPQSNLGSSSGKRGVGAPGEGITSIAPDGGSVTLSGTSVAAAVVTASVALLWSLFPHASALEVKSAVVSSPRQRC